MIKIPFKNKRGQIPILMLFVVTIVLVILSLVSFVSFGETSGADRISNSVSGMVINISDNQASVLKVAKNIALSVIGGYGDDWKKDFSDEVKAVELGLREGQVASYGNFFAKARDGEFNFLRVDEFGRLIARLEIKDLFVQAKVGNNYQKRNFTVCMLFDLEKKSYIMPISSAASAEMYSEHCKGVTG